MSGEWCSNCKFYDRMYQFDESEGDEASHCCRYPPLLNFSQLLGVSESDVKRRIAAAHYPLVSSANWCGEWKPATEGEA